MLRKPVAPHKAARKEAKGLPRCPLCLDGRVASKSCHNFSPCIFIQDPDVPTETTQSLEETIGKLSWPKTDSANAQACRLVADACTAIPWATAKHADLYNQGVRCEVLWHLSFRKLSEISELLPDSGSCGPLLCLRLIVEVAASTNVHLPRAAEDAFEAEIDFLHNLEGFAIYKTLELHHKLPTEELWFLVRRGAADAKTRKNMFPGRYLPRWRQLLKEILRMRNCHTKLSRALQGKRLPAELVEMIHQHLFDLEGILDPSEYEEIFLVDTPPPPYREDWAPFCSGKTLVNDYIFAGQVVWDPTARRFAWVWEDYGCVVYYGFEPSLHFDLSLKKWVVNQKQIDILGDVFVPKALLRDPGPDP